MFSKMFKYNIFNKKSDRELTYGDLFAAYTKMVADGKQIIVTKERLSNDDLLLQIYKKRVLGKMFLGRIRFGFHSNRIVFVLGKCSGDLWPDNEFYEDAITLTRTCKERADKLEESEKLANKFQEQKKFNNAIQQAKRCM